MADDVEFMLVILTGMQTAYAFVAQSSVAQKIIRPNVFRPTGFSPNRLHPDSGPELK